jgi:hypothetical protein
MGNRKEMKNKLGTFVYNKNQCINCMCLIARLDKLLFLFGGKGNLGMEEKIEN